MSQRPIEKPTKLASYMLLNNEKLDRARAKLGKDATELEILCEYDKYGGAIRNKEGRVITMGSFFDFVKKVPRKAPKIEFDDEYVLTRKRVKKGAKVEEAEEVVEEEAEEDVPVLKGPSQKKVPVPGPKVPEGAGERKGRAKSK
mgnify:CR=1 FL=1